MNDGSVPRWHVGSYGAWRERCLRWWRRGTGCQPHPANADRVTPSHPDRLASPTHSTVHSPLVKRRTPTTASMTCSASLLLTPWRRALGYTLTFTQLFQSDEIVVSNPTELIHANPPAVRRDPVRQRTASAKR